MTEDAGRRTTLVGIEAVHAAEACADTIPELIENLVIDHDLPHADLLKIPPGLLSIATP
ncbi:class I SAM-dependent rRNA methyltransferase [Sesbania bispinosa]|nr:class I SAM-dependent rRNA methyltransferase [Sesbania bispinosa]